MMLNMKNHTKTVMALMIAAAALLCGCTNNEAQDAGSMSVEVKPFESLKCETAEIDGKTIALGFELMSDGETILASLDDVEQVFGGIVQNDESGKIIINDKKRDIYTAEYEGHSFVDISEISEFLDAYISVDTRNNTLYIDLPEGNDRGIVMKALGEDFLFLRDGKWTKSTLKGINIGSALPGQDSRYRHIEKEVYLRWFSQISEANINTIRVYTRQSAAFYEALDEHNSDANSPLMIMQGIWIEQSSGVLDEDQLEKQIAKAKICIDAVHGSFKDEEDTYATDVSQYIAAFVVGSEWSPDYILEAVSNIAAPFDGKYISATEDASAFECLMARFGNELISYTKARYETEAALSYVNWPTCDVLEHPSEPLKSEDEATFNTENIVSGPDFEAGLFALYHVYPSYPEFIALEAENDGFAEYLGRIYNTHTVPVVVGEYGSPSSRGISHRMINGDYRQGQLSEREQGEQNARMTDAIFASGMNGALLFTWQDEWFKDVWNTRKMTEPERNKYWFNAQNSEQSFGLLAIFPGDKDRMIYVDADRSEWKTGDMLEKDGLPVSARHDEGYLYIMVDTKDFEPTDSMLLPISINEEIGSASYMDSAFEKTAQFVVEFSGQDKARLLVHSRYDTFDFLYGEGKTLEDGLFHPIMQRLRSELIRPDTGETIEADAIETGLLCSGITNPKSEKFNSLADFFWSGNTLEIRLPWNLIGFSDPSKAKVITALLSEEIEFEEIKSIRIGAGGAGDEIIYMGEYKLSPWGASPKYGERLKESYFIMKDCFAKY